MNLENSNVNTDDFSLQFIKQTINFHKCDEDYYINVMSTTTLPYDFVYSNLGIFNLYYLVQYGNLDSETVQYFLDEETVELEHLLMYQHFTPEQIKQCINSELSESSWNILLEYQLIPCAILQVNKQHLDWDLVSENQFMDLEFLISNINSIKWDQIPFNIRMKRFINEGMITLFQQTNIWDNIGYSDIDLDTLLKYKQKFTADTWESILEHHDISDEQKNEFIQYQNELL